MWVCSRDPKLLQAFKLDVVTVIVEPWVGPGPAQPVPPRAGPAGPLDHLVKG